MVVACHYAVQACVGLFTRYPVMLVGAWAAAVVLDASWLSSSLPTVSLLPVMALGVALLAASVPAEFEPAPAALLLAALGLAPPALAEVWTLPPALAVV